jgi:hypothetical protein
METRSDEAPRQDLLKKIDGKLAWICFFLILITLNTCSLDDSVGDALRDLRRDEDPAAATAVAPAQPTPAPAA